MTEAYEFSESQNGLIKDLSQKMRSVGRIMIAIAILVFIGAAIGLFGGLTGAGGNSRGNVRLLGGAVSNAIQGTILLIVGLWTQKAGGAFNLIVTTQGNDIENLMGALGELRKLYRLQYYVILISLVFLILVIVLATVAGIMARSGR